MAYELTGRASGLRAALLSAGAERARLIIAVMALAVAVALWLAGQRILRWFLAITASRSEEPLVNRGGRWVIYPWLIAAYPVLFFLSNNFVSFRLAELVLVLGLTLGAVSLVVLVLRLVLGDLPRAGAFTAIATVVFFAYGHIVDALGERAGHQLLLPTAFTLVFLTGLLIVRRRLPSRAAGKFLNYAGIALVAIPVVSIGLQSASFAQASVRPSSVFLSADRIETALTKVGTLSDTTPDIYYIILDKYARHDALGNFDNGPFLDALEQRGFYLAREAMSNYQRTHLSIPSSLNMRFLDEFMNEGNGADPEVFQLGRAHAVGQILTDLGYRYVHIASGFPLTNSSPYAQIVVDFAPSGKIFRESIADGEPAITGEDALLGRFWRQVLRTTILRPFLPTYFNADQNAPFQSWHPVRAQETFNFLKTIPDLEGATFVFAHVLKPHPPYNFDQFGNLSLQADGFDDRHDASVPSAYHGQLLYLNTLLLDMIDVILVNSRISPIIVIASDHGINTSGNEHNKVLAAYRLPVGGNQALYPSITSVNTFRVIFDYYFNLGLGLLEDRVYGPEMGAYPVWPADNVEDQG